MTSPDGALLDPLFQQRDLRGRDGLVLLRRRHDVIGVVRYDALDEFALLGLAGEDDEVAFTVALGVLFVVEAQFALAAFVVGAVAGDTVLGQDRADLPAEVDRLGRAGGAEDDAENEGGLRAHGKEDSRRNRGVP